MFCMKCGQNIPDGSKICPNCGFELPEITTDNISTISNNSFNYLPNTPDINSKKSKKSKQPKKKTSGCAVFLLVVIIVAGIFILPSIISGANKEKEKQEVHNNANKYSPEEYKNMCQPVDYDTMARADDALKGQYFTATGEIVQEISDGLYRLELDGTSDYIVISYSGERLLNDDYVTVWGESVGFMEGKNIVNGKVKAPKLEVTYLEKTEKVIPTFNIGETWTVDGKWSVTVNSVTVTDDRNQFSEKEPAAVYIVDYTYENLGGKDDLYISLDENVVDSTGTMGYSYPGDVANHPKMTPAGAKCTAQACIGVDNAGSFTIHCSEYDSDFTEHTAIFNIEVE